MTLRTPLFVPLLLLAAWAHGQAMGLNLGAHYLHPLVQDEQDVTAAALHFTVHKDFDRRVGAALDVRLAGLSEELNGLEFIYTAKYFCSDNEATAFYVGSFLGYQRLKGSYSYFAGTSPGGYDRFGSQAFTRTQVPIGLTCGVRGGLAGYFAELNLHLGYNIGGGASLGPHPSAPVSTALYTAVGFSWLGFGWDQ